MLGLEVDLSAVDWYLRSKHRCQNSMLNHGNYCWLRWEEGCLVDSEDLDDFSLCS